ncbi:hypothetical protein KKD95_03795 [Patescibacteria group bacterium]|nr:hypothetical protein [Patescibacteria group bacterium]
MSDVQFEGENSFVRSPLVARKKTPAQRLVAWGFAKDEKQANYILAGAAALVLLVSVFIFFTGGTSSINKNPELVPAIAVPTDL